MIGVPESSSADPSSAGAPRPGAGEPAPRRRRHRRAVRPGREQPLLSPTSDDADVGWGDGPEPDDGERLRREVPPHWGKD
jgi:hypothetical protein